MKFLILVKIFEQQVNSAKLQFTVFSHRNFKLSCLSARLLISIIGLAGLLASLTCTNDVRDMIFLGSLSGYQKKICRRSNFARCVLSRGKSARNLRKNCKLRVLKSKRALRALSFNQKFIASWILFIYHGRTNLPKSDKKIVHKYSHSCNAIFLSGNHLNSVLVFLSRFRNFYEDFKLNTVKQLKIQSHFDSISRL